MSVNIQQDYFWLHSAYSQLMQPILQQRAHHAWLIGYVHGCGEQRLIQQLIARLLCLSPKGELPCGHCHSCLLVEAQTHPDYHHLMVEKDKKFISVEQVRQLTEKVYEHAQQGGAKVIWIDNAVLMTEAAANALLKTLEEPPANTYFILTDNQVQRLMPTIRSRCFQFMIAAPELVVGMKWLQPQYPDYSENQIATALLLNEQAPLAAAHLLQPEHWQIRLQFCQTLTESLKQGMFWPLLSKITTTEQAIWVIDWFCSFLLDALKAKNSAGRFVTNRDQVPLIRLLAQSEIEKINHWYDIWCEASLKLTTISGLNQELIIADLLAQSEIAQ
ncbi:DNA polymerase III subunit delta' [Utexia brackfieldae]|uniref:DNA polymerase III subunit delta' n=1 Tax=Utexia brackfieldae TaxID=3074108 RepID=UPI00370D302D